MTIPVGNPGRARSYIIAAQPFPLLAAFPMKICSTLLLLSLFAAAPVAARQKAEPQAPPVVASAQKVLGEISAGQFDIVEGRYDARLSGALAPGQLAMAWGRVLAAVGSFESVVSARVGKTGTLDVVILECKFQKGEIDAQIAFGPEGKLAGLHFGPHRESPPPWTSPPYAHPDSFSEQPLTLVNGKFELPGTLAVPNGAGPFPAVVLLHDSGPHDQDETIGPNKPLKDLAWGLATRGIVVFRYTKRTGKYGAQSNADPAKLTVDDETISDAQAAAALLGKQPKIDPMRILIVGHGLGAYLAPRIAASDPQIAGIVMLAANTRPLEQLLLDEIRYAVAQSGAAPSADDQKQIAAIEDGVKKIESPDLKPGEMVTLLGSALPSSYWLDLRNYNPIAAAEALKIPMLFLQGGRDFQVPLATNFDKWQAALADRGAVTLKLYPDLNHLFMSGTGPVAPPGIRKARPRGRAGSNRHRRLDFRRQTPPVAHSRELAVAVIPSECPALCLPAAYAGRDSSRRISLRIRMRYHVRRFPRALSS